MERLEQIERAARRYFEIHAEKNPGWYDQAHLGAWWTLRELVMGMHDNFGQPVSQPQHPEH